MKNNSITINEKFGFHLFWRNEHLVIKVDPTEIPNYETFMVLDHAITNARCDDYSGVSFKSDLTEYDRMHLIVNNERNSKYVRDCAQKDIDYCDGKIDEPRAFYRFKDREEPKTKHIYYDICWSDYNDYDPNVYRCIQKAVNNVVRRAKRDGTILYGDVSKVKFYRLKLGLSQEDLAEYVGVPKDLIVKIEDGSIPFENCDKAIIRTLAEKFEAREEELLDNSLKITRIS